MNGHELRDSTKFQRNGNDSNYVVRVYVRVCVYSRWKRMRPSSVNASKSDTHIEIIENMASVMPIKCIWVACIRSTFHRLKMVHAPLKFAHFNSCNNNHNDYGINWITSGRSKYTFSSLARTLFGLFTAV